MSSPYDPTNWYWVVAGSATHVYSSSAGAYVAISDGTYVAWLAADGGNAPTAIATEALLFEVLALAEIAVPTNRDLPLLGITGLDFSAVYSTRILTVNPGTVMDSTGTIPLTLPSAITKDLALDWTAGDAGGAMVRVGLTGTITATTSSIAGSGTAFTTELVDGGSLTDYANSGGAANVASCISRTGAGANGGDISSITNNTAMNGTAIGGSGVAYMRGALDSRWSGSASFVMFVNIIRKDTDGSIDVSLSSNTPSGAPDLPTGYTYYRCIGWILIHYGLGKYRYDKVLYEAAFPFAFESANYVLHTEIGDGFTPSDNARRLASTATVAVTVGGSTITHDVVDDSITYAKMQNVSATSRVLGRITSGAGDVEELTGANVATILGTAIREKLTGARTYYVRTDGSDSNTGLANSSGGAFLTLQKAWDTAITLDIAGYSVTISVQSGTYTAGVTMSSSPVGGLVTFTGSSATVSVTSGNCFALTAPTTVTIGGFTLSTTTSGQCLYASGAGSKIAVGASTVFGACAGAHMYCEVNAEISIIGQNYTVSGSAVYNMFAIIGGIIRASNLTATMSGTPAWSTTGILFDTGATVSIFNVTYSGSATGKRYTGTMNAVLQSYGAGSSSTHFPGNSNGTTATGAQQG
jgi:hypothetical protein